MVTYISGVRPKPSLLQFGKLHIFKQLYTIGQSTCVDVIFLLLLCFFLQIIDQLENALGSETMQW